VQKRQDNSHLASRLRNHSAACHCHVCIYTRYSRQPAVTWKPTVQWVTTPLQSTRYNIFI